MDDVQITLTDTEWYALMKMAHERDVTLNKFVEEILLTALQSQELESIQYQADQMASAASLDYNI